MTTFLAVVLPIGALIGGLIGNTKGRPLAGVAWGALLGPVGWLIIFLAPDERARCRHCGAVAEKAVCPRCGRDSYR